MLRKPYLRYFFRSNGRPYVQVKVKNPKTAKYLKCKLPCEIQKSIYLKNGQVNRFKKRLNSTPTTTRKSPTRNFRCVCHFLFKPISRTRIAVLLSSASLVNRVLLAKTKRTRFCTDDLDLSPDNYLRLAWKPHRGENL